MHYLFHQIKVGIAILISDKIYFLKMATRDKKGNYNDQGINPRIMYNNYKYIWTQHLNR